ncbi:MAG: cation diffusion facilitator family transporter [Holosporaceae bacterium]|jgi:ferrous-iron efflux pump FieF|nr:cation diffusion facilitator family transporter [Holosporaceae bacterium]
MKSVFARTQILMYIVRKETLPREITIYWIFTVLLNVKLFNRLLDLRFGDCSRIELAKKSAMFGVVVSIFLITIKLCALEITGSISMRASLMDSILDALFSFLAYHALVFSDTNLDKKHNFGREKVESIAALFQCLLVVYTGIMVYCEAYETFLNPKPLTSTGLGISIMVISCLAVYNLLYFQRYVVTKTDSLLIHGDSLHYLSDFLMNISIMISLILSQFFLWIDVLCGVMVGGYVLRSAFPIIKNALMDLMDTALPPKVQEQIMKVIESTDGVESVKTFRTRSAGMKKYVESRVAVGKATSLREANEISESIESKIKKMFEKVDVIVKVEPRD